MMLILEHTSNFHFLSTKPFGEKLYTLLRKEGLDQTFSNLFLNKNKKLRAILVNILMDRIKRNLPTSEEKSCPFKKAQARH